jgi:hypothetical protein
MKRIVTHNELVVCCVILLSVTCVSFGYWWGYSQKAPTVRIQLSVSGSHDLPWVIECEELVATSGTYRTSGGGDYSCKLPGNVTEWRNLTIEGSSGKIRITPNSETK